MPDIIYTGKGLAPDIPSEGGKAMSRLSDFIMKAEEIKYNAFKETQDWFVKSQDVDPVMFLTTANQIAQDKLLKTYNEESSAILKASGNNLSTEDRARIIAGKNFLISEQQKMQADMARALQDRDAIQKDIQGNLDHDEFNKRWSDYVSGNASYGTEPLSPSAIDPDAHYSKLINKGHGTEGTISLTTNKGGISTTEKKSASATEEEARQMVASDILGNDRLALGYIEKFQKLKNTDPATYMKYLDTSGDQQVDATEEQAAETASNPIIRWAQDNYWQKRIIIKEVETTKPETKRSTFNWNIGIGVGNNRNRQYDDQGFANFNKLKVNSWLDLGRDAPSAKDRQIQDYVDTETGEKKHFGSAAEIKIVGYSPDRDMIIVKITKTSENRELREGDYIGLSGDKYKDWLESKPFGIDRDSLLKQYGQSTTYRIPPLLKKPEKSGVVWAIPKSIPTK